MGQDRADFVPHVPVPSRGDDQVIMVFLHVWVVQVDLQDLSFPVGELGCSAGAFDLSNLFIFVPTPGGAGDFRPFSAAGADGI